MMKLLQRTGLQNGVGRVVAEAMGRIGQVSMSGGSASLRRWLRGGLGYGGRMVSRAGWFTTARSGVRALPGRASAGRFA